MQFLSNLDLTKNQIQNAVVHPLTSDPSSPVEGQFYYNSTNKVFSFRTNSGWVVLGTLNQISAPTADVALGGFKLTGLGTPTAAGDASTKGYVDGRRLDEIANPTAARDLNNQKITNLADPTADQDAANKRYVDSLVAGLSWKEPVRIAFTANQSLAGIISGATFQSVTLAAGNRVGVFNNTTGSENGIYVVQASGAPVRATDADSATDLQGTAVMVEEGTNASTQWIMTTDLPITLGTTALVWSQFGGGQTYTAGNGLQLVGNAFSVVTGAGLTVDGTSLRLTVPVTVANGGTGATDAATARGNLGVPAKVSANVGNGAATSIAVTHNLNTRDVQVYVYRNAANWDQVFPDIQHTDANTVTLIFASAPASNAYRVVIVG